MQSLPGQYAAIGAVSQKDISDAQKKADEASKLLLSAWNSNEIAAVSQARQDLETLAKDAAGLISKKVQFPNSELIGNNLGPGSPAFEAISAVISAGKDGKITDKEFKQLVELAEKNASNMPASARIISETAKALYNGKVSKTEAKAIAGAAGAVAGNVCMAAAPACSIAFSFAASTVAGPAFDLATGAHKKARRAAKKSEKLCEAVRESYESTVKTLVSSYNENVLPNLPGGNPSWANKVVSFAFSNQARLDVIKHMERAGVPKLETLNDPSTGSCDIPRACKGLQHKGCYAASTVTKKASRLKDNSIKMMEALEKVAPKLLSAYADIGAARKIKEEMVKLERSQRELARKREEQRKIDDLSKTASSAKARGDAALSKAGGALIAYSTQKRHLESDKRKRYVIVAVTVGLIGAASGALWLYKRNSK